MTKKKTSGLLMIVSSWHLAGRLNRGEADPTEEGGQHVQWEGELTPKEMGIREQCR